MRLIRHLRSLLSMLLAAAVVGMPAHAAPVRTGHVSAELVADQTALVPGSTATLALRLSIDPGWHTYWRNPGESGLPTTLAWHLPPGYSAGDIVWPAPRALPVGPLMNYGYEGEVFHLVPLSVPLDAKPGATASLAARADWLVCRETCIPEGADLALALPVAAVAAPSRSHDAIAATRAALPGPVPAGWDVSASASGPVIALRLTPPPNAADPGRLQFFANADGRIEASSPQKRAAGSNGGYVLELPVSHQLAGDFARLAGVLRAERGFAGDGGTVKTVALDIPLAGTPVAGPKSAPALSAADFQGSASVAPPLSLPLALALAFAGGLLLNLMPCVFPVLSLKALGLAMSDGRDRRTLRLDGVAFAAGVIVAFTALGALLAALRAAGEQLGWGFQLQSPAVVTALAMLFFVMALNLSGVFEFGSLVPSRIATWSHANRHVNGFASGLLAVAIASPCTAPFMGAALGYALGERVLLTLGVFVALGAGMALPYLALAWFPQWRRALPRPGPWMPRLKQVLAFPLYATVAWLVWVLGAQVGNDAVMRIGLALVLIAFALWAWRAGARAAWSGIALIGALAGALVAWPLFASDRASSAPNEAKAARSSDGWQAYSPDRVAELTAEGRPVFVDYTAAWCITCQVNERFVLNDARVRDAFARHDVVLVRADWTRRDAAITEALAALGRSGVPAYVIYRSGRAPQLLPEVLQRQTVIDALAS
jgi:thiol:disulfide interchange protein/DsbC/DsbD-like thiol-disulfide interchange protein